MACCPTEKSYGYESCRFERDVDQHLHCSICYNVLKEPRTCRNNEHMFCLDCITEHLTVNSQTCPECNEHLSVDQLRRPRVVNNILSKLKIKCDYASRGCSEFIRVEGLQTHVKNCGFAPVLCSNQECGMEINKKDKVYHDTKVCEYRKMKCRDCAQTQQIVERLEGSLMELDGKVQAVDEKMNKNHVEMRRIVGKLDETLVGINKRRNEKVETLKNSHDEMKRDQQEVKKDVAKVMKEVKDVNKKVEAARRETTHALREVKDVNENISKLNKDVDEVKVMMSQMLKKLNMLELLNQLPSPIEGVMDTPREDILIAGGFGCSRMSTEIYPWEKNAWLEMSEMNEEHKRASSFIYKERLFVVGGEDSKTIETFNLNELPLKWTKFPGELPYACSDHQTVVYQDRIIHIAGRNYDEDEVSNVISKLQLASPCTMKELCQMPEPRAFHGAEIFEDKILIMGGVKVRDDNNDDSDNNVDDSDDDNDGDLVVSDSVLEFDVKQNRCKEFPPLPHALVGMATVRWKDQVVVLGGKDEDDEVLNDVFIYDCKTGKTTALPSMLEKRYFCCAVITGNTIVVMGGANTRDMVLSSVECFTMGGSTWEYLPALNTERFEAIAAVLPSK